MSKKWLWAISTITMIFLFSGCASLKCLDGSCDRQIKELTIANDDLKKEAARLNAENKEKEKVITADTEEVLKLQREKTALNTQVRDLQEDIQKMKKDRQERAAAIKSETIVEKQTMQKAAGAAEKEPALKPLKIKVLAGDGRLASARKMAKAIEKSGLKVEIVDIAPRSNFSDDIIYYKADTENEAKAIARTLGEKTLLKSMTWSSTFNIIAVSGKK